MTLAVAAKRRIHGYTLVELLAVMAVLGILAMSVFPLAELTIQRDRERELRRALWEIRDAIDAYKRASDAGAFPRPVGGSGYPPSLQVLVEGVPDARGGGRKIYFLRRIPRDPFAAPEVPDDQTWGLRSYESPPDQPRPGADVFDVHSLSARSALDGSALRHW